MRLIIIIIISIFFHQSFVNANGVHDFQIEGMGIGESLLDHFDAKKINDGISETAYKSDKFIKIDIRSPKFETYEVLQFHVKKNSNYTIYMVSGGIFIDDIEDCHKQMIKMDKEVSAIFQNVTREETGPTKHRADSTGKSTFKSIYYDLENGDGFRISCFDWSEKFTKEKNFFDHLKLTIYTDEVRSWIVNEAY